MTEDSAETEREMWLYRLYDVRRRLLYIGITGDVERRLSQHTEKPWGHRIARHTAERIDPAVARELERDAIREEHPMFNTVHKSGPATRIDPRREEELRRRKAAKQGPATEYGSINEVASFLGVNVVTVRRRIADGSLTGYRMPGGRLIRIRWIDVEAMLRPIPAASR